MAVDFRKKLKAGKPKEPVSDAALSAGKKPGADAAAKLSGRVLDEGKAGATQQKPIDPADLAEAPADASAELPVSSAPVDLPEPRAAESRAEAPTMESPLFPTAAEPVSADAAANDGGVTVDPNAPEAAEAGPQPAEAGVGELDGGMDGGTEGEEAEFGPLPAAEAATPQPQGVPSLADVVDVQEPDAAAGPTTVIKGVAAFSKIGETHPIASGYQLGFMGMADANACNFTLHGDGKKMTPVILNPGESKAESVEIEGGKKMTVKLTYRKEVNAEGNKEVEYEAIAEMGAMKHALATKKAVGAAARSGWKGFMRHWQEILTGISGIAIAAAGLIAQSQTIKAQLGSMYNLAFAAVGAVILAGAVAVGVLRGREKQD